MVQQVQELIDKIKTEGIQAAENKASEIENQAQGISSSIVADANKEKERIIQAAQQEAQKLRESAEASIQQASRDMILSLRKKIQDTLDTIVKQEVKGALSGDQLGEIITTVVKGYLKETSDKVDIKVYLSKADTDKLKNGLIKKLQDQLKKPITFESTADVEKGFVISFDGGKSSFDFSDDGLAEHLSIYLNEEVASLLKKATSS